MKYTKIKIWKYKGIKSPVEINFSKSSLIPIIGVNECGKTTILEGLLSFDRFNDDSYGKRHIQHIQNLYDTKKEDIIISAVISYSPKELSKDLLKFIDNKFLKPDEELEEDKINNRQDLKSYAIPKIEELKKSNEIEIFRFLNTSSYSFSKNKSSREENLICEEIVRQCPFMLYFDDFRDEFNGYVKLKNETDDDDVTSEMWYKIVNKLFEETNSEFSIKYYLNSGDQRKNILSDVKQHLNSIINKSWINFNLEKGEPPVIEISHVIGDKLRFEIVEKIKVQGSPHKKERHFGIKERSKGFYWFFNFIMKLHFNPQKRYSQDKDTIYLLDEPGSYLHSSAQKNLLDQLTGISKENKVVFTTHSPFLLDPKKIPLKNILISNKSDIKGIQLDNFATAPKKIGGKNSPFQIILHYLEITPMSFNFDKNRIVIVEGIFDYYLYEMLKGDRDLNFFPSSNADSIIFHISYMIADSKKYSVVWDNDVPGKRAFSKAEKIFGEMESEKWNLLPLSGKDKVVLENLIEREDKAMIKEELGKPSTFKKLIVLLYYSDKRKAIIEKLSEKTKQNFNEVYDLIQSKM